MWQILADVTTAFDKIHGVVVMLIDTGGNREDVGIKNDVLRSKTSLGDKQIVAALTDRLLLLQRVRLSGFVKGHHHDSSTIATTESGFLQKVCFAFLQADRVDDALALDILQATFKHLPFGRVDHDRDAADVRLRRDQTQKFLHRRQRVQHAFVHIDVDDLRTVFHLLQRNIQCLVVIVLANQARELARPGYVGAFADIHEQAVRADVERFQSTESAFDRDLGNLARLVSSDCFGDGTDMHRRRATAAANNVYEAAGSKLFNNRSHFGSALIIFAERIGQAGVGVCRNKRRGQARNLFDVWPQLIGTQSAVKTYRKRLTVPDRVPEGFYGLAGQRTATGIRNGARDHDRQLDGHVVKHFLNGEERSFGIQCVKDCFHQQQISAATDQTLDGDFIVHHQAVKVSVAVTRVVYIGRQRSSAAGWADDTRHKSGPVRCLQIDLFTAFARQFCTLVVQLSDNRLQVII